MSSNDELVLALARHALEVGSDAAWSRAYAAARTPPGCALDPQLRDVEGPAWIPFLWWRCQWERHLGASSAARRTYERIHQPAPAGSTEGGHMARKRDGRKCGECRKTGHDRRSCPKNKKTSTRTTSKKKAKKKPKAKAKAKRKPKKGSSSRPRSTGRLRKAPSPQQHAEDLRDVLDDALIGYLDGLPEAHEPEDELVGEITAAWGVAHLFGKLGWSEGMALLMEIALDTRDELDDLDDDDDEGEPDEPETDDDPGGAAIDFGTRDFQVPDWMDQIPEPIRRRLNGRLLTAVQEESAK